MTPSVEAATRPGCGTWIRRGLWTFGVLTALAAVWIARRAMPPPEPQQVVGSLHLSDAFTAEGGALQDAALGDFTVSWNVAAGGALEIRHHQSGRIVWATVPGQAFLAAGVGTEHVEESKGSFRIRDHRRRLCLQQEVDALTVAPDRFTLSGRIRCDDSRTVPYQLILTPQSPRHLAFEVRLEPGAESAEENFNRLYFTYSSQADEKFYGFGEQFTYLDLKGRRVPIFVMEQGIGRGRQPLTLAVDLVAKSGGAWHTTYAGMPFYVTSRLRSLVLENYAYTAFDLRQPDRVQIELFGDRLEGQILYGNSPAELLEVHTGLSGRMRPLPSWIHGGAVVGMQGGTEKVRRVLAQLDAHQTPISAFWLQDWVGQRRTSFGKQLWWSWQLDTDHYPQWHELLDDLRRRDIRVLTYVNPFLVPAEGNGRRNLFEEARRSGFLIRDHEGEPYMIPNTSFSAGMLDLTHPQARRWMLDVLQDEVIAAGASGWMADFGEALPYDAQLHDGDPKRWHNRYPEAWSELNRQAIDATGRGEEFVVFSRSAYRRSPASATLFWLGDQNVTWDRHDGLKSSLTGLLSGGLSGLTLNHSDIGGYTTIEHPLLNVRRDRQLLLRWMEVNAFSVVFRTHEGNRPDANAQFYDDDVSLAHFSRCAKMYRAWAFYRQRLVQEAADRGLPVVRPMWLHYPEDSTLNARMQEQFLVGDQLLVAPVLDADSQSVRVVLPTGQWEHLWSQTVYGAGPVDVQAPLGQPPVFFPRGSEVGRRLQENLRREGILATGAAEANGFELKIAG